MTLSSLIKYEQSEFTLRFLDYFDDGDKISRVFNEINDFLASSMKKIALAENQAWLEGRRCSECGKEKEPQATWSMCDDCV